MDPTIMGVIIAISVAVGVAIATARQKKQNATLATSIEPLLKERGPMTLPGLQEALGMRSFLASGKVVLALNDLIAAGHVEMIPAPEGTPQLRKVDHITYRWRA